MVLAGKCQLVCEMEFSGTFELEDTTVEEVWLALSDPALVEASLPGCEFLVEVDDTDVDFDRLREETADRSVELSGDPEVIRERAFEEGAHYAAVLGLSVGPVNPTFETVVTIETREFPEMHATGEGTSGDSSFEMSSGMTLSATDDGVAVEWETEADVFGTIAQMGQRVVNPVANRVVKRFFSSVQERLRELTIEADGEGVESDDGHAPPAESGGTAESAADDRNEDSGDDGDDDGRDDDGDDDGGGSLVDRVLGRGDGDSDSS